MSLILDHRDSLAGKPGLHAFIAGVSAYPHLSGGSGAPAANSFGMRQLSATSLGAYRIYDWLTGHEKQLPAPLATVRLLLSPTDAEAASMINLPGPVQACTLENFRADAAGWREDAKVDQDDFTFFYFAGHGIQRTRDDSVLLLEDFGDGPGGILGKAVSTKNIFDGMAPSPTFPDIARKQVYFIDACRNMPEQITNFARLAEANVFDEELSDSEHPDDRRAPIFYGALSGAFAYTKPRQYTLFCEALLTCLTGAAATAGPDDDSGQTRWVVTVNSLTSALEKVLQDLNQKTPAAQANYLATGNVKEMVLVTLDAAPDVNLTLSVDPEDALAFACLDLIDEHGTVTSLPVPVAPHPFVKPVPAGTYTVRATIRPLDARFKDYFWSRPVQPPSLNLKVRVAQ